MSLLQIACQYSETHVSWTLHFFTKFSMMIMMTLYFQPKRSLQWKSVLRLDLSWSLYLLLSKVSVLARWSASFSCLPDYCGLAGERMLQKESAKVFFENPLLRHTSILLHCGISFTYIYMYLYLPLMKNTEDNNDSFSGSLKHFVFTAGSCWCWCWPGKSILATRSRICLLLVGRDGWSCIHVNSLQKYLFPLRPSVLCFWLQRISGNFN